MLLFFSSDKSSGKEDFLDFGDNEQTIEEIKKKQNEEFDFSGQIVKSMEEKKKYQSQI